MHLFTNSGMDPRRLAVVGLGENRPAESNDTEQGRNMNRRVLLVILSGSSSPEGDYAEDRGKPDAAELTAVPPEQTPPIPAAATTAQATPTL